MEDSRLKDFLLLKMLKSNVTERKTVVGLAFDAS